MSDLMKPVLVVWGSSCKSCRRPTLRPKNWGNKRPTVIKKSMRFFTIKAYRLYPKPFERRWLAVTITILWPANLVLRRLTNCWPKSTTSQPSTTTSSLYERLWRLFSLQGSLSQALRWSSIVSYTNAPMEKPFDGLCDRSTGINQFKERQLRLHSSHCWSTPEDATLRTGPDLLWCIRACKSHHRRSSTPPRAPAFNRYWSRLPIHLDILVIALLLPWH